MLTDNEIQNKFINKISGVISYIIKKGVNNKDNSYTYIYEETMGFSNQDPIVQERYIHCSRASIYQISINRLEEKLRSIIEVIIERPNTETWVKILNKLIYRYQDKIDIKLHSSSCLDSYLPDDQFLQEELSMFTNPTRCGSPFNYKIKKKSDIPNLRELENNEGNYSGFFYISEEEARILSILGKKAGEYLICYTYEDPYYNQNFSQFIAFKTDLFPLKRDYPKPNTFWLDRKGVTRLNLHLPNDEEIPAIIGKLENLEELKITGKCYDIPKENHTETPYVLVDYVKKKYELSKSEESHSFDKKLSYYHGTPLDKKELSVLKELNTLLGYDIPLEIIPDVHYFFECSTLIVKGNIISLKITDKNFKTLPDSIGNLVKLENFELSSEIMKKLPDTIGNLVKLEKLDLSRDNIKKFPSSFSKLQKLRELRLSYLDFYDIPLEIGALKALEVLYIGEGPLENWEFIEIKRYLNAKYEIRNWSIDILIDKIENNIPFSDVDLAAPNLLDYKDKIKKKCEEIGSFKALELLKEKEVLKEFEILIGESIPIDVSLDSMNGWISNKDRFGYSITNCHITHIRIRNKGLKKIPDNIGILRKLKILELSENNLIYLPKEMGNLNELQELWLYNNNFKEYPLIIEEFDNILDYPFTGEDEENFSEDAKKFISLSSKESSNMYKNWNVNALKSKIRDNLKLNYVDRHHPDLRKFAPLIEEACLKYKNETAKEMWKVLEKECMIKLDEKGNKLWL